MTTSQFGATINCVPISRDAEDFRSGGRFSKALRCAATVLGWPFGAWLIGAAAVFKTETYRFV